MNTKLRKKAKAFDTSNFELNGPLHKKKMKTLLD